MKQSAKDLAFDKERVKYRRKIRALEQEIKEKNQELLNLRELNLQYQESIRSQEEWINRLLEYMDCSKEDIQKMIQSQKDLREIAELFTSVQKLFSSFGSWTI